MGFQQNLCKREERMMIPLIDELQTFTYATYVKLLKHLKQKYEIIPLREIPNHKDSFLILRHDIDSSIKVALKMARLERTLDIRATYFVMFSNKLYNVLEKDNLEALRNLMELGHEIGLHYDMPTYEKYGLNLRETLETEMSLLSSLINCKVHSIACHNVAIMTGEDPFKNITGYMNANTLRFNFHYVSDSCRAWYLSDLKELLNFKHEKAQLLVHPFLWAEKVCRLSDIVETLFKNLELENESYSSLYLKLLEDGRRVRIKEDLERSK